MDTVEEETPINQNVKIVLRQTNYDEETALKKLEEHDNNIQEVIMEYMGIDLKKKKKEEEDSLTTNQKIFKSIRDFF